MNKSEILAEYMNKAKPEIEEKLKRYKKSQSMGDLNQFKKKSKEGGNKPQDGEEEEKKGLPNIENFKPMPIFTLPNGEIINCRNGNSTEQ